MKKANVRTTTYEHGEYLVDIVTLDDSYEAWLSKKDYGTKTLMFGSPKSQNTLTEFIDIVEVNLEDYENDYDEYET